MASYGKLHECMRIRMSYTVYLILDMLNTLHLPVVKTSLVFIGQSNTKRKVQER